MKDQSHAIFLYVIFSLLLLPSIGHGACRQIIGKFTIEPDAQCQILTSSVKTKVFPDARFLAETSNIETCNLGRFSGSIGSVVVNAKAIGGLTENQLGGAAQNGFVLQTAAWQTRLSTSGGIVLGNLYLRSVGVIEQSSLLRSDQFIARGGSGWLSNASATFNMFGLASNGALVSGKICGPYLWLIRQ